MIGSGCLSSIGANSCENSVPLRLVMDPYSKVRGEFIVSVTFCSKHRCQVCFGHFSHHLMIYALSGIGEYSQARADHSFFPPFSTFVPVGLTKHHITHKNPSNTATPVPISTYFVFVSSNTGISNVSINVFVSAPAPI